MKKQALRRQALASTGLPRQYDVYCLLEGDAIDYPLFHWVQAQLRQDFVEAPPVRAFKLSDPQDQDQLIDHLQLPSLFGPKLAYFALYFPTTSILSARVETRLAQALTYAGPYCKFLLINPNRSWLQKNPAQHFTHQNWIMFSLEEAFAEGEAKEASLDLLLRHWKQSILGKLDQKAKAQLTQLRAQGAEPLYLLRSLHSTLILSIAFQSGCRGQSYLDIAAGLNCPPAIARNIGYYASRTALEWLELALKEAVSLEMKLKGERVSVTDTWASLQIITDLLTA